MSQAFNLTAQLNLRGPSNIRNIVADIRRQLGTVTANVNLNVDPSANRNLAQLNRTLQAFNNSLAATQTSATNAASAITNLGQAINGAALQNVSRNIANVGAATQRLAQNAANTAQQVRQVRTEMEEFGRQSALAIRRFAAFSTVTSVVFAFTNAVKQGVGAFIEFDKEFVKLQQVTGESSKGLQRLASTITSLSSGLGVASSDLIQVSSTLAQAGLSAKDTERALKALALSDLAPSFQGLNDTVEGSIALMRQFDISAGDLEKALGAVNSVAAKFAVEAGDIIAAIQRTGGVFANASKGVSEGTDALNEFIAVFTSVRATTRESAETIATGLRTIFTRIQRSSTIDALKEFGVNLTDAEGKFVGAYKAVELLSRGLNQIDPRDLKFSQIVEELGGFRQIGKVIPLIQQFATAQQALKVAQAGQGSLAADAAVAQLSLANQITKVREEFLALIRDIGGSDTFQTLAKGAISLASGLIQVADSVKGVLPALTALMAIRGASAAFQFGSGFIGGIRRGGGARGLGNRMGGGRNANGGMIRAFKTGGQVDVPVALMPGEAVLYPEMVERIGVSKLRKLNYADRDKKGFGGRRKYSRGGVAEVPGTGNSDSYYTSLPEGSFVIRKKATEFLGGPQGVVHAAGYAVGGSVQKLSKPKTLGQFVGKSGNNKNSYWSTTQQDGVIRVIENGRIVAEGPEKIVFNILKNRKLGRMSGSPYELQEPPTVGSWAETGGFASGGKVQKFSRGGQSLAPRLSDAGPYVRAHVTRGSRVTKGITERIMSYYRSKNKSIPKKFQPVIDGSAPGELIENLTVGLPSRYNEALKRGANQPILLQDFLKSMDSPEFFRTISQDGGRVSQRQKKQSLPSLPDLKEKELVRLLKKEAVRRSGRLTSDMGSFKKGTRVISSDTQIQGFEDIIKQFYSSNQVDLDRPIELMGRYAKAGRTQHRDFLPGDLSKQLTGRANGGIIQSFGRGSTKPLQALDKMSRSDLINEAKKKGIPYDYELLGLRRPLTPDEIRRKQSFIDALSTSRLESQTKQGNIERIGKKRKLAVVGLTGEKSSETVVTPGLRSKQGRSLKGVPATLETGALPKDVAVKVQAIIRNRSERIVAAVGKVIAEAAGTMPVKDKRVLRSILGKQLPDLSGLLFESGLAAAGAPYDPKSKAIDFNRGLGKELSNLFGIDPKALTDATNDATKDQAKRKLNKGQFDRGRRDAIKAKKAMRRFSGGFIKLAYGGMPLVDDLPNSPDALLPIPGISKGSPLYEIIKNGGGALDYDRTLQRTVGDAAYSAAKTAEAKEAVLQKYFRDPETRIRDAKTARLTQFGVQLQQLIKKGVIQPKNLSIISKSSRTPGLAEHINKLFGIPSQNMVFTSGGSKLPALEAIRSKGPRVSRVSRSSGGEVPILAQEGEYVINRRSAKAIGYNNLSRLNKYHTGGKVQKFASGGIATPNRFVQKLREGGMPQDGSFARLVQQFKQAGDDILTATKKARQSIEQQASTINTSDKIVGQRSSARQEDIQQNRLNRARAQRGLVTSSPVVDAARTRQEYIAQTRARIGTTSTDPTPSGSSLRSVNRAAARAGLSLRTDGSGGVTATDFSNNNMTSPVQMQRLQRRARGRASFGGLNPSQMSVVADTQGLQGLNPGSTRGSFGTFSQRASAITNNAQRNQAAGARMGGQANFSAAGQAYLAQLKATQSPLQRLSSGLQSLGKAFSSPQSALQAISNAAKSAGTAMQQAKSGISGFFGKISSAMGMGGGGSASGGGLGSGSASMRAQARQLRGQGLRGQDLRNAMGGGAGGRAANAAFGLSFIAPMIADQFTTDKPTTAAQASQNAMAGGIGATAGSAAMLASMGPAGIAAAVPVAIGGLVKAFADAENAANEFNKQLKVDKLEDQLEKAAKGLDKFARDLKNNTLAKDARSQVLSINKQAEDINNTRNIRRGLVNFNDEGPGASQRSEILNREGIMSYLSTTQLPQFLGGAGSAEQAQQNQATLFSKAIPELSKENAKNFAAASDSTTRFLESTIRSGKSITDLKTTEGDVGFQKLTQSLALADDAIQQQIMTIENSNLANKEALKNSIIATAAETKAREIQSRVMKEMDIENLNKATVILQNSLERMFQNMEQAISSNVFSLDKLTSSAELASASLSGSARVGSVKLDSINTLQNPRANAGQPMRSAVDQAASMFGNQAPAMKSILQVASSMEDAVLSTINKTLKSNPTATNESVGGSIDRAIFKTLSDLKLPPDLSSKLSTEVGSAIADMRKSGEDKVDFSQLVEKIPQLGKVLDSAKRAQEVAIKALENWQNALNEYANTTNQLIDLQIDSNQKLRRATDILINGQNELARAFGKSISLQNVVNDSRARTASQTGGPTDPAAIRRQIQDLELRRQSEQARADTAGQKGFAGKDEFMMMQDRLKNTSVALRESYDALKNLSENTEVASAAMSKISELQQKQQAGVSVIEKLITSTPREINSLNKAFMRLDRNMRGQANFGTTSNQRRESLDAFNMIMPFLGDNQSGVKANVLESMMAESGMNMTPMLQQVIDSLRNPMADPQMAEAIAIYNEANALQAEANKQLVFLNTQMMQNSADVAATKLAQSMQGVVLKFESQQLADINAGITNLIKVVEAKGGMPAVPAVGKARGGMMYAAAGQLVNFEPKGTDTVPAMLTPGEFVVNRQSTQKHLPLLKYINNNRYSGGGKVGYYAGGGLVFGDPWQKADKDNALERSGTSEKESKDFLSGLNLKALENVELQNFETLKNAPSYIVNRTPGILTRQWVYGQKDLDLDTQGLEWRLGSSYSSFRVPIGGGAGTSSLEVGKRTTPGTWDSLQLPSTQWISKLKEPKDRSAIKETEAESRIKILSELVKNMGQKGGIPDIADQTDFFRISAGGKTIDLSKNPKGVMPSDAPKIDFGFSGNKLTVSGLSANSTSSKYSLLLDNAQKNLISTGNDKGNFIGVRQDFSSVVDGILQGVSYAILKGMGDENTGILGTHITAGASAAVNPTGGYNFGQVLSNYIKPTSLNDKIMDSVSSNIVSLSDLVGIKEKISLSLEQLKDPNNFIETEKSIANKEYVNKLQQLISGSIFKATFSENEIQGKGDSKPPMTLYNLDAQDWDSRVDTLMKDASVPRGTYAGKKGPDWIPVGSKAGGGFRVEKWFPWISSGFNSTIFDDLKNKYNAQNPNNVKVTPGSYSDEFMTFNYKDIEGPMFDANKKMTKGRYKFTTASLDPGLVKEPLNPFKDLVDQKLLAEGSEIYSNSSGELINTIKNWVANTILKTQQNTLFFGGSIKRLVNDPAISALDFSQETKDNAYLLNSIAPGFQYDAKLYGNELRKKIAQQQQNQQAAAGERGIANKANIQDLPEDPVLLTQQAKGIVSKVLTPVARILSGYNIRLFPLRTASQIAPYGNYLLQAQKFFGNAVTQKFGKSKKGIDQRLWDTWGALGASGQVFQKLGAGDKQGIQTILGSAAGLSSTNDLGEMVANYGRLLATRGSTFAGSDKALSKELGDNDKQAIEGIFTKAQTEEATVARDGRLTVNNNGGRNLPTNLLDLGKKIVNPYSTFEAQDRSSLFDILIKGIQGKTSQKLVSSLQYLQRFYASYLDPIVSGKLTPNENINKGIDREYPGANATLQVLTNGEYGKMPDAKKMQELAAAKKARMEAEKKANGGIVYAQTGTLVNYQPRGTDTVPAMLTPGEFVVNRKATQQNLSLLKAINSGQYRKGGQIGYLAKGGVIIPQYHADEPNVSARNQTVGVSNLQLEISNSSKTALQDFNRLFGENTKAISDFATKLQTVANNLSQLAIPEQIQITAQHKVEVILNGAQALNGVQEGLKEYVVSSINTAVSKLNVNTENALGESSNKILKGEIV